MCRGGGRGVGGREGRVCVEGECGLQASVYGIGRGVEGSM